MNGLIPIVNSEYQRLTRSGLMFLFLVCSLFGQAQNINSLDQSMQARAWADSVMHTLSLDQKIGQLFMVAAYSNRDSTHENEIADLINQYHVGGLIFFQGGPGRQTILLNKYRQLADIPLWIAMDAEWGVGMRLDSTMSFPYQMTLGAIQNDSLIYDLGQMVGRQFRRLGMHMNYAPVLDVNNNPLNPVINFRSFGDDKLNVANKGIAYMRGLQDANVMVTGKHFPGHGDTETDSHKDLPVINHEWDRLKDVELYPFRQAMAAGMEGVMIAHLSIPSLDTTSHLPSTLSPPIVTGLLRDSLRFAGMVFTDALQMQGVTKHYAAGEIEVMALEAGNDVLLFPQDLAVAIDEIKVQLSRGRLSGSMIDQRCRKVLEAKYLLNIDPRPVNLTNLQDDLHKMEARVLNRALHAKAITVVKNDGVLPVSDLGQTSIAAVHIGYGQPGIWQERLNAYTNIHHIVLDKNNLPNAGDINTSLADFDLVLIGVENLSKWPFKNYGITDELNAFLGEVIAGNTTVLTWLGSPYGLEKIDDFDDAAAIVLTYQEDEIMRDMAAQVVFGGMAANGRLPVKLGPFASGSGITLPKTRLSYGLPEEAGLDGAYLRSRIDSIAHLAVSEGVAPGLQVLVARDEHVVYHQTYGFHRYDSLQPVRHDDIYDLASITKITGALPALMQLHDQGLFDIDATMGTYIPYFARGNKKNIPLRKILSHNARLRAWIPYWTTTIKSNGKFRRKTLSRDSSERYSIKLTDSLFLYNDYRSKIYKMIKKSDLLEEETYVYSGLSFYLYPEMVENLTGRDFESYLQDEVYQPLGAMTVGFNPYKRFELDRIIPTEVDTFFRNVPLHGRVHDEGAAMMDGVSSNAGLFASANDLAKIMQMYLNMGSYGGKQYISSNTMRKFTFCHYCETGNRRGLAFDKPVLENKENGSTAIEASAASFGHSGYTGTFTWADPETGILFIFMSNRVYPTRDNSKLYQLNIRPSMHQVIYDARIR